MKNLNAVTVIIRDPFELLISLLLAFFGAMTLFTDLYHPKIIEIFFPHIMEMWWGFSLLLGGTLVLCGMFFGKVRIHLAGLSFATAGLGSYGLLILLNGRLDDLFSALTQIVFAVAFGLRSWEIHKSIKIIHAPKEDLGDA